ncbi:MAG: methylmalonyl Co-A mutase-associated GTPase MeaB [Dehalococcoidales bacterium]|nr:methylmalonyl Co-A mutase-associated GTPase MeaB [Dehalococcoidales bacterium]
MLTERVTKLINGMLAGQKNSLAQLISLAENDSPDLPEIIKMLHPHRGKAYCVGITGPPGGGKSTLIDRLTATIRSKGWSVGIIAVDPSSPISGGAVLGDRIRMNQHYLDEDVFIRSMATRGSHGGLSKAVASTVKLLDASGKDIIIVETVGVGQTELSIKQMADTLVLVLVPGYGDALQVMKAGSIEVADIIVVNKADYQGAERLVNELRATLTPNRRGHEQSIITTQAINGIGIGELYQALDQRRKKR